MATALVHTVDVETQLITSTIKREWDYAINHYHGKRPSASEFYYISMEGGTKPPYESKKTFLKQIYPKNRKSVKA